MTAKEKIIEAADHLFGKLGFDAASTREIAEMSGVNKALIHYHFKNKDGLLEALLDRYYQKLAMLIETSFLDEGDLKKRLLHMVDIYMDFLEQNRNFGRIVQREAAGGQHMDRIEKNMVPLFELGSRVLKDSFPAAQKGELAAEQMMLSAYGAIIIHFIYGDMLGRLVKSDPRSPKVFKARKKHIHRLIGIMLDSMDAEP